MSKKAIRLITLLLAVAMVAALAAGCGGSETKKPGGSDLGGVTLTEEEIANLKGTKVTYVTWKDPNENEDRVAVEKFEEKYGIDLHPQLINEYNYVSIIAADIAAGTQGDVFFENGEFPGSLKVMQPLEAARLDLSDPIWNQSLIKASTLDGHPYLVDAISNVWTEVDICIYNKKIFDDNGIKTLKNITTRANGPSKTSVLRQMKWLRLTKLTSELKSLVRQLSVQQVAPYSLIRTTRCK